MDASINAATLTQSLRSAEPPLIIDVRRTERFREWPYLLKSALQRELEHGMVVYDALYAWCKQK
jgi:hypothetical protein